jgi:hypothetical protein
MKSVQLKLKVGHALDISKLISLLFEDKIDHSYFSTGEKY